MPPAALAWALLCALLGGGVLGQPPPPSQPTLLFQIADDAASNFSAASLNRLYDYAQHIEHLLTVVQYQIAMQQHKDSQNLDLSRLFDPSTAQLAPLQQRPPSLPKEQQQQQQRIYDYEYFYRTRRKRRSTSNNADAIVDELTEGSGVIGEGSQMPDEVAPSPSLVEQPDEIHELMAAAAGEDYDLALASLAVADNSTNAWDNQTALEPFPANESDELDASFASDGILGFASEEKPETRTISERLFTRPLPALPLTQSRSLPFPMPVLVTGLDLGQTSANLLAAAIETSTTNATDADPEMTMLSDSPDDSIETSEETSTENPAETTESDTQVSDDDPNASSSLTNAEEEVTDEKSDATGSSSTATVNSTSSTITTTSSTSTTTTTSTTTSTTTTTTSTGSTSSSNPEAGLTAATDDVHLNSSSTSSSSTTSSSTPSTKTTTTEAEPTTTIDPCVQLSQEQLIKELKAHGTYNPDLMAWDVPGVIRFLEKSPNSLYSAVRKDKQQEARMVERNLNALERILRELNVECNVRSEEAMARLYNFTYNGVKNQVKRISTSASRDWSRLRFQRDTSHSAEAEQDDERNKDRIRADYLSQIARDDVFPVDPADSKNDKVHKFVENLIGNVHVVPFGCDERGSSEEGYLRLCSACQAIRRLPDDYFPTYINEVICDEDKACLYFHDNAHGKCKQKYMSFDVLRNVGTRQCQIWRKYSLNVRTSCECFVYELSFFARYVG